MAKMPERQHGGTEEHYFMQPVWMAVDGRLADLPTGSEEERLIWKELQDRERELRVYRLTKKAVFVATFQANLLLAILSGIVGAIIFFAATGR
jgi:hypothetical protein